MLTGAELALLYGNQVRKGLIGSGKGGLYAKARELKKTIEQYNQDTERAKKADENAFLRAQKAKEKDKKKEQLAKAARQKELNAQSKQRQAKIAQQEKDIEEKIRNKMLGMGASKSAANRAIAARRNQQQIKSDWTNTVMTGQGTGKFAPVEQKPVQISQGAPKVSGPRLNPLSPKVKGQITKTANKQTPKISVTPIPQPASPVIKTPGSPVKIPSKSEMDNPVVKKLMS